MDYALFVGFFPLLVAGPIERATHLLPQIQSPRRFELDKVVDGCKQVLWGLFKKVVIADNAAEIVNLIFDGHQDHGGSTLLYGAVLFAFQIYGDFSGYSDIALGTARILGIELLQNFNFPYFSRDIAEFWRRWHISLSTWFRDYVYIPLGGSRGGTWMKVRNTFVIFLVSGFWHGANWTFIVWGALHALFFLPVLLSGKNRSNMSIVAEHSTLPSLARSIQYDPDLLRCGHCLGLFPCSGPRARLRIPRRHVLALALYAADRILQATRCADRLLPAARMVRQAGEVRTAAHRHNVATERAMGHVLRDHVPDLPLHRQERNLHLFPVLMKLFLQRLALFMLLPGAVFVLTLYSADGRTDPFYLRFTTPRQSSLILGTRARHKASSPTSWTVS